MDSWAPTAARQALGRAERRLRKPFADHDKRWRRFSARLESEAERIFELAHSLYGWRWDFAWHLEELLVVAARASAARSKWLRKRDRDADHSWMTAPETLWGQCYVDRFAGDFSGLYRSRGYLRDLGVTHLHVMPPYLTPRGRSDGGYAVSDYRRTRPELGTMSEFRRVIREFERADIDVVLDFVANHTADDHPWAKAARRGDARFRKFYLMFADRTEPDRFVPWLREIFPDRGGDAFTWRPDVAEDGAWVWTTFHEYQWDLDYRNPEVLTAMTGEIMFLANLGASVIRMDATPFLWKRQGTSCENLPETHQLLQLFNALMAVVAPSVRLLSEAIVHPDDVEKFIRPEECQLGYNPLVMSSLWEALATRDTSLLGAALRRHSVRTEGCQRISYLRCHDDIGWGFADEDAQLLEVDPRGHREFLNRFYAGDFPGSFAAGELFQHNPRTGDARMSGSLASLAGLQRALEAGDEAETALAVARILMLNAVMLTCAGIPLIYLGDELGQLNDEEARDGPDNRWMHRGVFDWKRLARARQGEGPEALIFEGMLRLIDFKKSCAALDDTTPEVIDTGDRGVLAFRRGNAEGELIVVANFTPEPKSPALAVDGRWRDAWSNAEIGGEFGELGPYGFCLLLQTANDS